MLEDFVEEKNVNDDSLINDDIAIVLKPNFKNNKWNHTVDVNAIVMPQEKLKDIEQDELKDVMYALITCFNLLNKLFSAWSSFLLVFKLILFYLY